MHVVETNTHGADDGGLVEDSDGFGEDVGGVEDVVVYEEEVGISGFGCPVVAGGRKGVIAGPFDLSNKGVEGVFFDNYIGIVGGVMVNDDPFDGGVGVSLNKSGQKPVQMLGAVLGQGYD